MYTHIPIYCSHRERFLLFHLTNRKLNTHYSYIARLVSRMYRTIMGIYKLYIIIICVCERSW